MTDRDVDVAVVGAGPVGLTLAGDLAAAGVRVVLVERRAGESNLTRAFGVHARTMEELDARGLADELITRGRPVDQLRLFDRVHVDLGRLPSRFPYLLITPQYEVEALLHRRAEAAGVEFVTGAVVTDVRQDADGVELTVAGRPPIRASYAVGADGVGSTVRRALGLPFPGAAVLKSIMLGDVRMTEAPAEAVTVNAVGDCFAFVAPFGDGWYRVFAWDRRNPQPDDVPMTLDELRDVARRALGTDFGMHDPRWMSRFHSDERQVPQYRVGRVFLAGDAAHVHSPAGGQGMNTGIQDAANLGWKLAAAVHGWAPAGLLDSYQAERHPVGRQVLRSSGAIIRAAMIRPRVARLLRGVVGGAALRVPPIADRVAGTISGVGIRYPGAHGAGARAADVPLADGRRLYEALRAGTFVLVGTGLDATGWAERVRVVEPADPAVPATLVRPDGYVAWTGRPDEARSAVARWCGTPSGLAEAAGAGSGRSG
jgi:2-polyprenyl-6-methoxyphenol hydroxylase-like FAD-dependent oxidoreductase